MVKQQRNLLRRATEVLKDIDDRLARKAIIAARKQRDRKINEHNLTEQSWFLKA